MGYRPPPTPYIDINGNWTEAGREYLDSIQPCKCGHDQADHAKDNGCMASGCLCEKFRKEKP